MVKKQIDERIVETRRKVSARCCSLFLFGLLIILLYRQFYLGQEFSDYGDIFVLWLIGSLYLSIGGTLSGLELFGGRKFNYVVAPFVIATTILGLGIYKGSVQTFWEGLSSFVIALIASGIVYYLFMLLYRFWEKRNLEQ